MKTKLYWTLLSILHIIKLIVCSLIPEGYVSREFNQLGLLTRDGSSAVDSINLLRCIKNSNVTGNATVSISVDNDLVITLEGSDAEKSKFISAAATCYRVLGYGLGFSTRYNLTDCVDLTTVGNLRDVLETLYVNSFGRVQRNRITQQSVGQGLNQTESRSSKRSSYDVASIDRHISSIKKSTSLSKHKT